MNDLAVEELTTLQDGLQSPFWTALVAMKDREWGIGGARYAQAVQNAAAKGDEAAVMSLRMTIFAQQEIERLFRLPVERVQALKSQLQSEIGRVATSRRGPGL